MERFAVELLCVSNVTVAAYCVDRRASDDGPTHSVRLWIRKLSSSASHSTILDPKVADVIIPLAQQSRYLDACTSQIGADLMKVIHVDSFEQSVPNVYKCRFNRDSTRAVTAPQSSGRSYDSLTPCITIWSEMLRRVRVLQLKDIRIPISGVNNNIVQLGSIIDIGFGGYEQAQLVFACYTNGTILGWDISSGHIVCSFYSSTGTISALPQEPVCFYCVNASIFVGYSDGKVKHYEVVPSSSSVLGRSNPRAALRTSSLGVGNSEEEEEEEVQEEVQWQHRERAVVDLSRELRFRGMTGDASVTTGVATAVVKKELVLIPLCMCHIQPPYSCLPGTVESGKGGSSSEARKRTGWDLPANFAKVHSKADVGVTGQLCIVTASGAAVVDLKSGKVVHTVSLEALQVSSISAAACNLVVPTSGADMHSDSDPDPALGIGESSDSRDNSAYLAICFLAAFSGVPRLFKLPLFTDQCKSSGSSTTPGDAEYTSNSRENFPVDKYSAPAVGIGYDNIAQLKGAADLSKAAPRRTTTVPTCSKADSRHSVYEDETVPLTFFMHPSMLPDRCEESPRDDYDGDDVSTRSRLRAPRSLLASPVAKSALTGSSPAVPLRRAVSAVANNNWEAPKKDKQGKLQDQPITFQRKIKSSGYGQIPQDSFERKRFLKQQQQQQVEAQKKQQAATAAKALQRSLSAPRGGGASRTTGQLLSAPRGAHIRTYPLDCQVMQCHQAENDISTSFPVHGITFSEDGSLLGVATADSAVLTVRLPASKYRREVVSYAGHNSRINNVSFTHSKYALTACGGSGAAAPSSSSAGAKTIRLLPSQTQPHFQMLSCSADGTARMWRYGNTDNASVVFSHMKHSVGSASAATASAVGSIGASTSVKTASFKSNTKRTPIGSGKSAAGSAGGSVSTHSAVACQVQSKEARNRPFADEITYASYFYMDKFAVLTSKASVLMYRYNMHSEDANDDLKRTLAQGTYQLVHQWDLSVHAQSVCAVSCINSTPSPLIFCATSDKFLNILDASTGTIARAVESPHTRNIHCIALPRPSLHVPLSPDAYNLFLTSAIDNNINMWDLRAPSAVNRYSSHVNKREPVGCDISPCLRYIATGSEDKNCVIYDIRAGRVLHKLTGHKDVVRAVAFNPLFPQLATGSYDGTVKFYVDPTFDAVPL